MTRPKKNRWPNNPKKVAVRRQNPDDPQPRRPEGTKQRGGVQTAEQLRNPPMRESARGGMLRSGGTNKGGKGATPSVLRSRCRGALAKKDIFSVPVKIIKSKKSTQKEKLDAWKALAQYGGLTAVSITDGDGNPIEIPPFVVQMMDAPDTEK
jgi:hypothetical protein